MEEGSALAPSLKQAWCPRKNGWVWLFLAQARKNRRNLDAAGGHALPGDGQGLAPGQHVIAIGIAPGEPAPLTRPFCAQWVLMPLSRKRIWFIG